MKYTPKEKRLLKKLGIEDFRHMTKDKVMQFTSMLPKLNPEVAKAAINQFPNFSELAKSMIFELRCMADKNLDLSKDSQKAFFDTCNHILSDLSKELDNENLTPEEKDRIENKMLEVARMVSAKDSEIKKFAKHAQDGVIMLAGVVVVVAAAILGAATTVTNIDDSDSDDGAQNLLNDPNIIEGDFEDCGDDPI